MECAQNWHGTSDARLLQQWQREFRMEPAWNVHRTCMERPTSCLQGYCSSARTKSSGRTHSCRAAAGMNSFGSAQTECMAKLRRQLTCMKPLFYQVASAAFQTGYGRNCDVHWPLTAAALRGDRAVAGLLSLRGVGPVEGERGVAPLDFCPLPLREELPGSRPPLPLR